MSNDLLLGQAIGRLDALRDEHDKHAELARTEFARLHASIADLRDDLIERKTEKAGRHRLVEVAKFAAMMVAAAFTGHLGGSH